MVGNKIAAQIAINASRSTRRDEHKLPSDRQKMTAGRQAGQRAIAKRKEINIVARLTAHPIYIALRKKEKHMCVILDL